MAFQFVPNADGSFDEGMRQTNPETGVEYIFSDGGWRPLGPKIEDQFDELDERYVNKSGDTLDQGASLTLISGGFKLNKPDERMAVFYKGSDTFTQLTSYNGHGFKVTARDGDPGGGRTYIDLRTEDSNGTAGEDGGYRMKLYHVATPTSDFDAANKKYVDNAVSNSGGGVPVGSIMMWINSVAPSGWLKLKGTSFDINAYPLLHAYLQQSEGYVSGKLPDWRGHYPGQIGDHLNGDVGIKLPQQTAMPSGGAPKSSSSIPNGTTRTFNGAGGTSAYSDGQSKVTINDGWDTVTRPKTVAVHFIIKHD